MKKRFHASRRDEAPKKSRKGARRCPCCGSAPCSCEKSCFCQELKGGLAEDDGEDETALEDDFNLPILHYGEQRL